MRFLVLSSILLLLFNTGLSAQKSLRSDYPPKFESVKYRAAIDVIGRHLSGILLFKTQEDSSIRTVFVNEMGVTFFDITFFDERYSFNTIMQSMDKKAVKISLAKDIGMILMRGILAWGSKIYECSGVGTDANCTLDFKLKRKGKVRYHVRSYNAEIPLIENFGKKKKVISIQQFYHDKNQMPDSIFVQHHNVNFTISLKQLHVTE